MSRSLTVGLLIVTVIATFVAWPSRAEEDAAAPEAEEEVPEPRIRELEGVPEEVIADVVRFCKEIRFKYHPILAAKQDKHPEGVLFRNAHALGHFLDDKRDEHVKKDHNHFSCAEAQDVLRHSLAKKFVNEFAAFVNGEVEPKITNAAMITLLKELSDELRTSGFVNNEVVEEIDQLIANLEKIGEWHTIIAAGYKAVNEPAPGVDCAPAYVTFLKELEQLSTQHMPNWEHIDSGLVHLIHQCAEDPHLRPGLEIPEDEI